MDWLKAECDFRNLATEEIESCCKYEYLRESKGLREGLANPEKYQSAPVVSCVDWMDNARLVLALIKAGYPAPWKRLGAKSKADLAHVLSWNRKNQERHPVLMVEEFAPGHDSVEQERLLEQWRERAYYTAALDRNYVFGLFRLDKTYNETDAIAAFSKEFKKRWPETKGGGSQHWPAMRNDLVVMRLRKRFPKDPLKRAEHVAEFTTAGFKGCKDYWDGGGAVDRIIGKAANEEISKARAKALKFFQSLFPGERPLSWQELEIS